ncbi:hypothetical protein HS088_TW18G00876 [Tripterygium wilfordii]|uniref:MI domain-containing protein n=1 Tax=Tripterygium wilfordii TaxID=458696 RepID=A0A7J7CE26_TRIWF|nr:hypothetical protein HS088_TW18G00876 [Tripterygium wilfordii]
MASGEGFLTDEQREVLKTATLNVESLSSSPKSPPSLLSEHLLKVSAAGKAPTAGIAVRHIRRSHSGKFGRVKKDGAGGKGTWGKLLDTDGESQIDRNDPNYDSGEEPYQLVGATISDPLDDYKKAVVSLIEEYFSTGDVEVASSDLRELGSTDYHPYFIKRLVSRAMDRHDREKEMASVLLSALYADVISPAHIRDEAAEEGLISSSQMAKGFARLAESLDDLALDIPSAKTLFQSLVPKAISEGWLDTSFTNSGEDGKVCIEDEKLRRYKEEAVTIIHEYFLSYDIPELIRGLEDLGAPSYNSIFLKKLITLAMDRKNREKEMASVLLSALHIEIFSTEDMVNGFVMLLESAEDTALDILDASNELALFLARAVIDDVLAPLNLEEIGSKLPPNCSGSETVHMAQSLIAARHAGERILRCWGGGTGWAVEDAKDKIQKLLEEYESGGVVSEACQCIRDIGMPFFNHEVVKKALVMAMEKKNDRMLDLLQECFSEGLITINQMTKGFTRIKDGLDDLALDIPNAKDKYDFYVEYAQNKGWLLPSFESSVAEASAAPASAT